MNTRATPPRLLSALVLSLSLAAGTAAWAQTTTPTDSGQQPGTMGSMGTMHDRGAMSHTKGMRKKVMGMHAMPATVDSVDQKTGLVEATTEGMSLKVHFPPSAIANLKAGDKITLHMGYSKP